MSDIESTFWSMLAANYGPGEAPTVNAMAGEVAREQSEHVTYEMFRHGIGWAGYPASKPTE